jgi:uncharacterized protein (DUF2249 family)
MEEDVAVLGGRGVEAELVEQGDDVGPGVLAQVVVGGEVRSPGAAGGDRIGSRVRARPVDVTGEGGGQGGVLADLRSRRLRRQGAIKDRRPAATLGGRAVPLDETALDEGIEVLAEGVRVLPGRLGESRDRDGLLEGAEALQHRRAGRGHLRHGVPRRPGRTRSPRWAVGARVFHENNCNKWTRDSSNPADHVAWIQTGDRRAPTVTEEHPMTDTTTLAEQESESAVASSGGCGGACGGTGSCGGSGGNGKHGGHAHSHEAAPAETTVEAEQAAPAAGGCGGNCACNSAPATPVLDARSIEPSIRQSAIFGVLVGMPPHASVVIVAPQDPAPIVDLLESRLPGEYSVAGEKVSDDEFRVTFTRH